MSSTDKSIERTLRHFFQEELSPAAQRAKARGVNFLSHETIGPESFFAKCEKPASLFVSIDPASCQSFVHDTWRRAGLHELADLSDELFALAPMLVPPEDAEHDVSPLVYVMF
jgi:hypothetical protein